MKRDIARRTLLATTLVTTLATLAGGAVVAIAQPMMGSGMGQGPGGGAGPGMMGGTWNTAGYLDSLKTELGITSNQEAAWKEYADTVSVVQTQMQGMHQTMFDAMGTASWQERRDMMNQMIQARQTAFDAVHQAAEKLTPSLDPSQQAKARKTLPGLAFGPGGMGRP